MQHHSQLKDVVEDQLCLASIHYLRSHYQEAIDIYKRILLNNRYHPLDLALRIIELVEKTASRKSGTEVRRINTLRGSV